jgi:hypothetical protein
MKARLEKQFGMTTPGTRATNTNDCPLSSLNNFIVLLSGAVAAESGINNAVFKRRIKAPRAYPLCA